MHSVMTVFLNSIYFNKGYMIYRANVQKRGFVFYVICLNSMLLNMCVEILFESDTETIYIRLFLTTLSIGLYLQIKLQRRII